MLLKAIEKLESSKCSSGVKTVEIHGCVMCFKSFMPSLKQTYCTRGLARPAPNNSLMRLLDLVNIFAAFVDCFTETKTPIYERLHRTKFRKKEKAEP